MRQLLAFAIVSFILLGCEKSSPPAATDNRIATPATSLADKSAPASETVQINEWFEARFEEELAFSPIWQSFLGRKSDYDKLDDFSAEAELKQLEWRRQTVVEMQERFDRASLEAEAQTSYDIWKYQLEQEEASYSFRNMRYIFHQMQSVHAFLPQVLISFHPVDTREDMQAYVSRIRQAGRAIDQLIVRSRENAEHGVRPPSFAFEFVIDESTKLVSGVPFDESGSDNEVWTDARKKIQALLAQGKINMQDAGELGRATRQALLESWQLAYTRLIDWQKEDLSNANKTAKGIGSLPNGMAYYNERLANWTTTTLDADEIHETGLSEVKRLRGEMDAIREAVGFEGDLAAFFKFLRDSKDDERFYFPDTDEGRLAYISDATAAIEGIKNQLPGFFGIMPKADLEVKRVEAFREQDGAAQHYYPGTPDGSRNGVYYAHLSDMTALPKRELEVIAYHEGLPGHHMQISIAQELEDIPTFRTQAGFGAYSEGWGLYAEFLAKEMPGTYADPYSDFGRLGSEIWRAIRLVVDTGLHARGWSQEDAVKYFMANSAAPEAQARSEIRRYLVLPGQATSYKIGMMKILELRAFAKRELGADFDIRYFHDTVLGGGALPLLVLEQRVRDWVAASRQ